MPSDLSMAEKPDNISPGTRTEDGLRYHRFAILWRLPCQMAATEPIQKTWRVEALLSRGMVPSYYLRSMVDPNASLVGVPSERAAQPKAVADATSLLILVVERDPHIRELEAHFLKEAGFGVTFAVDGREALAQARDTLPDIVITEVLVPKLDGLALCRQLKADERTSKITVLIFSILAVSSRAAEAGADAFLMKPLAEQRLLSTVSSLIEKRHASKG